MGDTAQPCLRLADLLAALSVVTDLGFGQPPETAMRACLLATRLAHAMQLPAQAIADVYYTTLLRSVGCTAYAHEEAALWRGDDAARAIAGRTDFANPREALAFWLFQVARNRPPLARARMVATTLPRAMLVARELFTSHCEVAAIMARRLGMPPAVQQALQQVFERWDGTGLPRKLAGEALALPVRCAQVATQAVVFAELGGPDAAVDMVRRWSGRALDPAIARAFLHAGPALLQEMASTDVWKAVVEAEPEPRRSIPEAHLDEVARAFADMVDLKLPFTLGHSPGVAELAAGAARELGLEATGAVALYRAGLLHDLGRVGISNTIWEKPGPLTEGEWEQVRLHPYHSERILLRSPALAPLARIAGMHHERQDGSGYYRQLAGPAIPLAARLLAAADTYHTMLEERPHRPALDPDAAAERFAAEASRNRLDGDAVRAVLAAAGYHAAPRRTVWPAGLSDREVEVLRLIARGASYREVARALVITPKTARHHIEHIYDKLGVSTRAAATMFAMEHDLLPR